VKVKLKYVRSLYKLIPVAYWSVAFLKGAEEVMRGEANVIPFRRL
jgi:hypothetical protein